MHLDEAGEFLIRARNIVAATRFLLVLEAPAVEKTWPSNWAGVSHAPFTLSKKPARNTKRALLLYISQRVRPLFTSAVAENLEASKCTVYGRMTLGTTPFSARRTVCIAGALCTPP